MSKTAAYSWSASAAAEKARQKRASGLYIPLEKMDLNNNNNEKRNSSSTAMVNQIQDMLVVNDDEIFGNSEEEEEDFTHLPSLSTTVTTESATSDEGIENHKQYINSIRKTRPLPTPPIKVPERSSSKELPGNMTQVFNDNFKSQNKITAQQLFQLMSKSRIETGASSCSNLSDDDEETDDEEYSTGVYSIKTQIPSNPPTLNTANYHYDHFNASYYKLMTPVQEVEEEDQLFDIAQVSQDEKEGEEEEELPNFLLEPTTSSSSNGSGDSSLRPLSLVSLSAPSLVTSGRTSPSSDNSHQSMDSTNNEHDKQVDKDETDIDDTQPLANIHNNKQQRHVIQPQNRELQESDIINDNTDNSIYEFQEPLQFNQEGGYKREDISLLSDVKRLSLLNQALQSPALSHKDINPMDQQQQQQQQQATSPRVEDYSNVNTSSPTAMTSLSLTHDKESIKTYRRMATKTKDRNIQFTFAKYLLQLVTFYSQKVSTITENATTIEETTDAASTRDRLQEEAEYWIEKLAKSNHAEALYIKGQWHKHCCDKGGAIFINSQYKKVNHAKAFKCFQQAAKFELTEAHYEMAEYLVERKEYKKAISSYRYAASKDHFLSLYKLANIMLRGLLSQEKDIRQGLTYLKKAADLNRPECARPAYDLACIYSNDLETIGLDRNSIVTPSISNQTFSLAVYYYKKADYFGLVAATYRLGYIFEYGHLHTEVNVWEAYKYYTRAAEKNHEGAMLELSRLYKEGVPKCLEPSPQKAYQWCLKATENGNEVAEYVMGTYHEMGVATRPDYSQAIKWYKKASYKGYGPAENKLNIPFNQRVSRRMANSTNGEEGKEVKNQPQLLVAKKNKKYYEESVRIAEKSRKATATSVEGGGESCQIM